MQVMTIARLLRTSRRAMPCCDTIIRSNMTRIVSLLLICFVALAACTSTQPTTIGADGRPLPTVYKIRGNPEKPRRSTSRANART